MSSGVGHLQNWRYLEVSGILDREECENVVPWDPLEELGKVGVMDLDQGCWGKNFSDMRLVLWKIPTHPARGQ